MLPVELIIYIYQFLGDLKTIKRFSSVSRNMRQIYNNYLLSMGFHDPLFIKYQKFVKILLTKHNIKANIQSEIFRKYEFVIGCKLGKKYYINKDVFNCTNTLCRSMKEYCDIGDIEGCKYLLDNTNINVIKGSMKKYDKMAISCIKHNRIEIIKLLSENIRFNQNTVIYQCFKYQRYNIIEELYGKEVLTGLINTNPPFKFKSRKIEKSFLELCKSGNMNEMTRRICDLKITTPKEEINEGFGILYQMGHLDLLLFVYFSFICDGRIEGLYLIMKKISVS